MNVRLIISVQADKFARMVSANCHQRNANPTYSVWTTKRVWPVRAAIKAQAYVTEIVPMTMTAHVMTADPTRISACAILEVTVVTVGRDAGVMMNVPKARNVLWVLVSAVRRSIAAETASVPTVSGV